MRDRSTLFTHRLYRRIRRDQGANLCQGTGNASLQEIYPRRPRLAESKDPLFYDLLPTLPTLLCRDRKANKRECSQRYGRHASPFYATPSQSKLWRERSTLTYANQCYQEEVLL